MIRSHNVTAKGIDYTSVSILSLASAIGILENGLILWVVGFRMRRTVISIWILNLALSDFLATTTLPFFAHYVASGHTWLLGRSFCKVQSTVFFVNMFVSAFLLAAISLDRCLLVLFPVWAQNRRNVAVAYRVSLGAWLLALANALPYTVYRTVIGTEDGRLLCYHDFALYSQVSHLGLADLCRFRQGLSAGSKFLVAFLFPLLVIGGSHVAVALRLRKRRGGRGSSSRQSRRFLKLVVAVVVAFFCCWSPYHMMCVVEAVSHDRPRLQGLVQRGLPLATTFSFLNCVLNPFLYVFSCPNFSTRIRQSLSAVLEGALMEDTEIFSRRGTPHSLTSTSLSTGVALSTYTFQQSNESKKKTPCEDERKKKAEKEKGASTEKDKEASAEKDKESSTEKDKETSTEKDKESSTEKDKESSTEKDKETSTEKDKKTSTEKDKEASSEKDKETSTEKDKETSTEKDKETSTEKDKQAVRLDFFLKTIFFR
ncbi:UNVERIFIED_CONTAM: hypothetical protein FKN15_055806 [Acipenser sinensis]